MQSFAPLENRSQQPMSSSLTRPHPTAPRLDRPGYPTLQLQRALGNRAMQDSSLIQAKLIVGQPDDKFEQEADRVANAVTQGQVVQRACAECEKKEESGVQRALTEGQGSDEKELEGQGTRLVRRSADGAGAGPASPAVSAQIAATRGSGQQLPEATRSDLGSRMGADFSEVRLHTDSGAAAMCGELGAHAFTVGRDIYFNHGRYNPQTTAGVHLLAHELTHTLQQAGPIRRLTVTPTKTFTKGPCGQHSVFWNFASGVEAPASGGYIVQNVKNMDTVGTCPNDVEAVSTTPKSQHWEAWWVAPGDKIQELAKNGSVDYTDNSLQPSIDGKTEHQAWLGTIKFFGKDTTGDLGKEDVLSSDPAIASVWKPGTKGGVAMAGWLPSTTSEPAWWNKSLDGPAFRWSNSWWNCCDADDSKHWSKSDASPK